MIFLKKTSNNNTKVNISRDARMFYLLRLGKPISFCRLEARLKEKNRKALTWKDAESVGQYGWKEFVKRNMETIKSLTSAI